MPSRSPNGLGVIAALLVAVIAGVHFQQYVSFISQVPTVGVLFLLNAAGGAGLAVALVSGESRLRLLAAVGSIGLAAGSLVSIAITLSGSFFRLPGTDAPPSDRDRDRHGGLGHTPAHHPYRS